jgi:hypothetical protein
MMDYDANQADELTLRLGDILKITTRLPDGWLKGTIEHVVVNMNRPTSGWFPAACVKEIESFHSRASELKRMGPTGQTIRQAYK